MTKFEKLYQEYAEARTARRNATTEEEKDVAYKLLDEFDAKFDNESRAFKEAWRDYRSSIESGYEYLNCEDTVRSAFDYATVLKENGIEKFTFSSTWSGSVNDAWEFQKAGYIVEGMTNIPKTAFVFILRK